MIKQGAYPPEPWCLRETHLDLELLAQSESLFALSNGHLGLRGNLDEGEPHSLPGTYLNSVHERHPLPYAEAGYGYPDYGETVVDAPNGKLIRLLVDDEPFDVRYGELSEHRRVLDLRRGVLDRAVRWQSPSGVEIRVRSTRLVSLTQRAIAAIRYEVEPVSDRVAVVVQSELVANETLPPPASDPRAAAALSAPFEALDVQTTAAGLSFVHETRLSKLRVASGIDHEVDGPSDMSCAVDAAEDLGRFTVTCRLDPGRTLQLTKYLAYGWSGQRSLPAVRDQVAAALAAARQSGWDGLLAEQRELLDRFWEGADVRLEGDEEIQQAVRFALFQLLQASARAERRPIPAKGLTGTGYDGHCFWDTESFVLPVLTYCAPQAAADALRWRADTLPVATEHARALGFSGAAFPWRTITGRECSAYWPAGTAAFHVNADIADAVVRLSNAHPDPDFDRRVGLPLLVGTARLWRCLGHMDRDGEFRIDGVTGPDEYSAVADNNVYTNLMAQQNLLAAADAAAADLQTATELGVSDAEVESWREAASAMYVPRDRALGVHQQAENFTRHARLDFGVLPPDPYPLLLHMPYVDLYRKQVVKQADLVLAMHLRGDAFTAEEKRRNFDYYEELTVRDSSLSACTQAVLAAEVGHLDLALDYAAEAALMDLRDLESNTGNGLHMAALAGTWIALVAGFGGFRDHHGELSFAPRLPAGLGGLAFTLRWRGARLHVDIDPSRAAYTLREADGELDVRHHGEKLRLENGRTVLAPLPEIVPQPRPGQPPGRAPTLREDRTAEAAPATDGSADPNQ